MMRNIILILILIVISNLNVFAQDELSKQERDSLRGLKGVFVLIEEIRGGAKEDGLYETQIQTDVELRLRKAGIRVLTKEEWIHSERSPWLYINIQNIKDKLGRGYAYYVRLSLRQDVMLQRMILLKERNQPIITATTWERGFLGTIPNSNLMYIRKVVEDYVDQFINDYLAINQK